MDKVHSYYLFNEVQEWGSSHIFQFPFTPAQIPKQTADNITTTAMLNNVFIFKVYMSVWK